MWSLCLCRRKQRSDQVDQMGDELAWVDFQELKISFCPCMKVFVDIFGGLVWEETLKFKIFLLGFVTENEVTGEGVVMWTPSTPQTNQ